MNAADYQTLIVKFSKPITELDGIFDDAEAWGVETLKGWVEDYESSRFTAIDSHTAVITSEYNMECVKTWLERNTPHSRENRILNIRAVSAPPEHNTQRRMNMIAKTILEQIGGRRFAAMTGSKDFIDMGNGLRMSLARNKTSANRLDIIYDEGADLYNMRFYRRTFSKKTFECRTKDIETHGGIYCDMLEEMFTMVTGLYTRF